MIYVTNTNAFTHTDRYNGVDYLFEPNDSVLLEEVAAQHMLGYGLADKSNTLTRLGWAFRYDEASGKMVTSENEGIEKLRKFIFSRASFVKQDDSIVMEGAEQADLLKA